MKNIIFLICFLSLLPLAHAEKASVYCRSTFTDEIIEITSKSKVDSCVADLIWGTKNVCFTGSADDLASDMNAGAYAWPSSGLKADAATAVGDQVTYTGTDAQSFYAAKRILSACTEDFF